jgi:hypothetical protein
MKMAMAGKVSAGFGVTSIAAIVSCSSPITTFDGQYVGTPVATNAGIFNGAPCSTHLGPVTLLIVNDNVTLLVNPDAHLVFNGPVTDGGAVAISGRNDRGSSGMSLSGVIANGQFDGRTSGLACHAEMHLKKINTPPT